VREAASTFTAIIEEVEDAEDPRFAARNALRNVPVRSWKLEERRGRAQAFPHLALPPSQ
jgi:hypothetical protein